MITSPRLRGIVWVGWLGITVAACGGSSPGGGATGGTTSTAGSGGSGPSSGSGGEAGPPASGGTSMTGGAGPASGGQMGGGTGGATGAGGSTSTGGASSGGGGAGSGGATAAGGAPPSGGASGTAGSAPGGRAGAPAAGGASGHGGASSASGGSSGSGGKGGVGGTGNTGTCTASRPAGSNATGSGPHGVTVETNAGAGISEGTIFRPTDLGGATKYPIFVWGEGACAKNGLANAAAMAEIASHGYFVIADGTPNGSGNRTQDRSMLAAMAAPLIGYIDWAIAENGKACSAYYQSLDTTKIAANGFSCGGLMSQAMVLDPRITTWGVNSSGMKGAMQDYYDMVHTPVLFVEGGPSDTAYDGAAEGYAAISKLNVPVVWFSKDLGHGGDLSQARGGDFTKIDLAWLNWWLKGDETATGKGLLVGAGCPYCSNAAWEYKSAHIP